MDEIQKITPGRTAALLEYIAVVNKAEANGSLAAKCKEAECVEAELIEAIKPLAKREQEEVLDFIRTFF